MSGEFDRAFELIIGHEGGYVNRPDDPGGETKFGISKRSYPNEDIAAMTLERAKSIYLANYWNKLRCGEMPGAVGFSVFDAGVNCGVTRSAEWLQKVLGVKVDAVIGALTLQALAHRSAPLVAAKFNALRLDYHASLPSWPTFGKGWARRISQNILLIGD